MLVLGVSKFKGFPNEACFFFFGDVFLETFEGVS